MLSMLLAALNIHSSAPIQYGVSGLCNLDALRTLALSSWLSAAGALLLLRELRVPFVRAWMRRHVRFVTTHGGRTTIQFLAATLGLVAGSYSGTLVGVTTLLNYAFGRHVRKEVRVTNRLRAMSRCPPTLAAPPSEADGGGTSSSQEQEACAADGSGAVGGGESDASVEADESGEACERIGEAEAQVAKEAKEVKEAKGALEQMKAVSATRRAQTQAVDAGRRAEAEAVSWARPARRAEEVNASARVAAIAVEDEEAAKAAEAQAQVARAAWRADEAAEAAAEEAMEDGGG